MFRNIEPLKAEADSISILPSNLSFQEGIKEIELLDDEITMIYGDGVM